MEPPCDAKERIAEALQIAGVHRLVPVTVNRVDVDGLFVHIDVTLTYLRSGPVCCGQPGCYVPFLGRNSHSVAEIVESKLELPLCPHVTMDVHLVHEPGYEYRAEGTGTSAGPAVDHTQHYDETRFSLSPAPQRR